MSQAAKMSFSEDADRLALLNLGGRNRRFDMGPATADTTLEEGAEGEEQALADGECELCQREGQALTRHHLIPRSRHRKARSKRQFSREEMRSRIAHICGDCHGQIHRLFTEKELAASYNTLEDLKTHEGMRKFFGYIRKQH